MFDLEKTPRSFVKENKASIPFLSSKRRVIFLLIVLIVLLLLVNNLDRNDAGYFKVIQYLNGILHVRTDPGWYIRWFGRVTPYTGADTLYFSKWPDESKRGDTSIDVRFTDGSIGSVSVNVRYVLPTDKESILKIHQTFRSNKAFQLGAIEQMTMQAVQLTASMMTAEDSYRNKRPQFIQMITDQIMNGLYVTTTETFKAEDGTTGQRQKIVLDEDGNPKRQIRDLEKYGVRITQVNVTDIDYEAAVNDQIAKKREASMKAELAKVEAEEARQARVKAEEEGKRNVTIAQYQEEEEKIKEVTRAQKEKEVAIINAQKLVEVAELGKKQAEIEVQKAKLEKQATIERAQGEAEARRLIMAADGALEKKLEAYVQVHKVWAEAYTKQRPTPDVVIGGDSSGSNAAQTLMDLLTIQASKDLTLDIKANK